MTRSPIATFQPILAAGIRLAEAEPIGRPSAGSNAAGFDNSLIKKARPRIDRGWSGDSHAPTEIAVNAHRQANTIFTPTIAIMREIAERTIFSGAYVLAKEPSTIPGIDPNRRLTSRP